MAKPRRQKLKVFRTPIGFHDAYVTAPSQKAALEAWGSDVNLFARGVAEEVKDPKLTKAALADPGTVIKVLRGSEAEQLRALGTSGPQARRARAPAATVKPRPRGPRPSRAAVDKAERMLERARQKHQDAVERIKTQQQKLEKRRRQLERRSRDERETLEAEVEKAREDYARKMDDWAG